MKKNIIVLLIFTFANAPVHSYEAEKYISIFQWDVKWTKVVSRAIDGYVERGTKLYPKNFTDSQRQEASEQIRFTLSEKIGWSAMKEIVVSDYRNECGDDLLDIVVAFYAGAVLTQEEKESVSEEYQNCARSATQKTMNSVFDKIEKFADHQSKILSSIESK